MIGDRWGVTDAEVESLYPCDHIVEQPVLSAWRGVSVRATPEEIWPWVTQIRLGPYSYDWLDNLGRRSPRTLVAMPAPVVGDPFTSTGGRPQGTLLAFDPPHAITGRITGAVMSYVLVPAPGGTTRLLLKIVMAHGRLLAPFVSVGDLVMSRRQLLTWRDLAEASTR